MPANLPTDKIISCFYGTSQDCVKVLDTSSHIMSFNPNGLKVMEIDDESQVIGKDWLTFWKGDMNVKASEAFNKAKKGELAQFEGYCPTFKGAMKYWQVSIAPLFGDFGEIQWLLVMSHDATRLKELEDTVLEQTSQIQELESQLLKV